MILSSTEEAFNIKSVNIETLGKINVEGCDVTVCLELESFFPKPVLCSYVEVAILPSDPHPNQTQVQQVTNASKVSRRLSGGQNLKESGKGRLEKRESVLPITCEDEDIIFNHNEVNPTNLRLELGQIFETKQDKSIQGGKITCHNSHQALRFEFSGDNLSNSWYFNYCLIH